MRSETQPYSSRQHMLSSDYEIFHYASTDLSEVCLHHHDFYECYLFLSGDVTYQIEGKTYFLKSGDIILINSDELHQVFVNDRSIVYERLVLWINKGFLRELSSQGTNLARCFEALDKQNVLRADFETQKDIRLLMNRLLALPEYMGVGKELLQRAYVTELMININNLTFLPEGGSGVVVKKSSLIDGIIEYISNHAEEDITIDELSEKFFLSKFHLSREFKKHTGTTIHRYIIQKKLIKAKELILTALPVTEVYKQCGFGDYSNFFRAFKNEYGVTPKQFFDHMSSKA